MSFNRGIKRDSFGNRNFNNRNMGGGGGGRIGNLSGGMGSSGGGTGGGMNPWESGMMPGRGILPTPNNNLSLASPQAQLAIASNLLSNLLRNQQDPPQQKVPSLLSLSNNYSGPGPNFSNQQSFNQGRFNDRAGRHNIKNQRLQPYNKMGNRARDGIVGRRGPQSRTPQSGNQRQNGSQNQRNDKSSKANTASKKNPTIKKEQQDKTSDKTNEKAEVPVALSEENEETEESKKREWKDEKKELANDKTDDSIKIEDVAVDKDESLGDKGTGKKSAARHAESRYADVPISNMFCHVCNKYMWDGNSFENHLRGRAHQLMMDKLDESYKLKVELMRHELRVAEEQRELSLTNSKRRGKKLSVDLSVREYCTMCDLNFYGTLSSHRKSEKHQQLKTFLHPRCFPCAKEFPSRIEYDEHCLTPTHMKNAVQNEEQRKNKKKDKLAKGESEIRNAEDEEKDIGIDMKNDKLDDSATDASDYVTEIPDEPIDAKLKIPSYKHCRTHQLSIGKSLVKEVNGYHCERCRRFMLTEEDMTAHLRSITHYRNFIQEIKTLQAAAEVIAKTEQENKEVNNPDEIQRNDEPDTKRVKLEESVILKNENEDTSTNEIEEKHEDEDDKYDPEEVNDETDEEIIEDENQDCPNDESNEISLTECDDNILEECNENENDDKDDLSQKNIQISSRTTQRNVYNQRARGNRARRSRR
ncbi:PREDICTED: zinc finger protein on ecdysone puffs [Ceratosolen solmsi marchali]|uniref:Zinc finger protein on ecdysone puffs n=1 Tax=Ceratosolen solmsi marchali TaxID=326594 RepID=A0AAJ7DZV6_9HYME|nr:PREDICTED: zinc finger protein on ecdysone puffs [Ceratosolen solmsi marchali]